MTRRLCLSIVFVVCNLACSSVSNLQKPQKTASQNRLSSKSSASEGQVEEHYEPTRFTIIGLRAHQNFLPKINQGIPIHKHSNVRDLQNYNFITEIPQIIPDPINTELVSAKDPGFMHSDKVVSIFDYRNPNALELVVKKGVEFVVFPSAVYQVGGAFGIGPKRYLKVPRFGIMTREVNVRDFSRFCNETDFYSQYEVSKHPCLVLDTNSSEFPELVKGPATSYTNQKTDSIFAFQYSPIANFTPMNAKKLCRWFGGRLPYSIEWEIAARTFHSSEELKATINETNDSKRRELLKEFCNRSKAKQSIQDPYLLNSAETSVKDLLTGLSEMCQEHALYGSKVAVPVRGGSWFHRLSRIKSYRYGDTSNVGYLEFLEEDKGLPYVGFRVVIDSKALVSQQ